VGAPKRGARFIAASDEPICRGVGGGEMSEAAETESRGGVLARPGVELLAMWVRGEVVVKALLCCLLTVAKREIRNQQQQQEGTRTGERAHVPLLRRRLSTGRFSIPSMHASRHA
jgi:hypothetical protein